MRIILLLLLFAFPAFGQQIFDSDQIQNPQMAAPKAGFVAPPLSNFSPQIEEMSRGSGSVGFPLSLPSEWSGAPWNFVPSYSSSNGFSEWGQGWALPLSIVRYKEIGNFSYERNEFSSPWGELVSGTDGYFYPKGLNSRVRIEKSSDGSLFTAYLPEGSKLYFGKGNIVATGQGTYAWYLSEAVDARGRITRLHYVANSTGRLFLQSVEIGRQNSIQHRLEVQYTTFEKPLFADFRSGQRQELDRLVSGIKVSVNQKGNFKERWHTASEYSTIDGGIRQYLTSIQRSFPDGTSEKPIRFKYARWDEDVSRSPAVDTQMLTEVTRGLPPKGFYANKLAFYDIDGDGRTDIERADTLETFVLKDGRYVRYSQLDPTRMDSECKTNASPNPDVKIAQARNILRFQGPQSPFLNLRVVQSGVGIQKQAKVTLCSLNGKLLWTKSFQGLDEGDLAPSNLVRIADINNDGKPDWIKFSASKYKVRINLSDSEHFELGPLQEFAFSDSVPILSLSYFLYDMNGDGLVDIVGKDKRGFNVYFGKGNLQFEPKRAFFPFSTKLNLPSDLTNAEVIFTDINRDGIADAVLIDSSNNQAVAYMNFGNAFKQVAIPGLVPRPITASLPRSLDLIGTGDDQLIYYEKPDYWRSIALNRPETGLIVEVDNGQGTLLNFSYEKSVPIPGLDSPTTVLHSVKRRSGFGGAVLTQLSYGNPKVGKSGHFLGFSSLGSLSQGVSKSLQFDLNEEQGPVLNEQKISDSRAPGLVRYTKKEYISTEFSGMPVRLLNAESSWEQLGSKSSRILKKSYSDFDKNFCPKMSSMTDGLDSIKTLVSVESLIDWDLHLHCLVAAETLKGEHSQPELNFVHTTEIARNAAGLPEKVWLKSRDKKILIDEAAYDENYLIKASSSPGKGTTVFTWNVELDRIEQIQAPDGTLTKVDGFDELSLQPLQFTEKRGTGRWIQRFAYDARGRLNKHTNSLLDPDLNLWLEQFDYVDPTLEKPGIQNTIRKIEASDGSFSSAVSAHLFDGAFRDLARLNRVDGIWQLNSVNVFNDDQARILKLFADASFEDVDAIFGTDLMKGLELSSQETSFFGNYLSSHLWMKDLRSEESIEWSLDADGRLQASASLNGKSKGTRVYDANGRLIRFTDPARNVYQFQYDVLGRIANIVLPDGTLHKRRFNEFGETLKVEQGFVGSVQYSYDEMSRLLKTKEFRGKDETLDHSEVFNYDGIGRQTAHIFVKGGKSSVFESHFVDDSKSDQFGLIDSIQGPAFKKNFKYRPDGSLNYNAITFLDGTSIALEPAFYRTGEAKTETVRVKSSQGIERAYTKSYSYDSDGRVVSIKFSNGILLVKYDQQGRVKRVDWDNSQSLQFSFDSQSQILTGFNANDAKPNNWSMSWTYNADGMVDGETFFHPSFGSAKSEYEYDERWFLKSSRRTGELEYSYDNLGFSQEIASRSITKGESMLQSNGQQWRFDSLGRIVRKNDMDFEFGANGRHSRVSRAGRGIATYDYDENSQLIQKEKLEGLSTYYIDDLIFNGEHVVETVKLNGIVIGILSDGNFSFRPYDLRSTAMPNGNDFKVWAEPFGIRNPDIGVDLAFDYAGLPRDTDTGFVVMGARFYEPLLGRFASADPMLFEDLKVCLESPVECNLYSYSRNNPLAFTDRTGQYAESLADLLFMAYDVASMAVHAYQGDANAVKMDQAAFVLDSVGLMLPAVTGLGLAARAEQQGAKVFYAGTKETVQATVKGSQFASRSEAFRAAKRDLGIPMYQHPLDVKSVKMTDQFQRSILDSSGKPISTREYHFSSVDGNIAVIQDHSAGHQFGECKIGDQGPHFNVRPINPETGSAMRNEKIPGTLEHYGW